MFGLILIDSQSFIFTHFRIQESKTRKIKKFLLSNSCPFKNKTKKVFYENLKM